jgi:dipeptidyl aminopeptidase/acylaminoacyl peptidase
VSRNEFGISSGIFWSPDSKKLAFYVKDEHSVTDYPLVDITARVAEPAMIKYPMAGMGSEVVSIGIYSTLTNEVIFLDAGNPDDHYLTNLTWTPDGSELYIAEINRGQDTVKMNRYNAGTGKIISNIFTETDEKYVNPLEPAYFIPGRNNDFIWLSRKDGYNHFYLHTSDGLEKQLTKGNWEVLDFKGFDKKGTEIFFTATKDGYVNEMFYKVDISSGKISLLTPEEGVHEILLNGGEGLFLDRFSSAAIPNRIILRDKDGRINTSILEADDPLKDYTIARIETATITAADGSTELTYRMFTPSEGIVPGVKYPAIVYVYNGPMNQLIRNEWITVLNCGLAIWLSRDISVLYSMAGGLPIAERSLNRLLSGSWVKLRCRISLRELNF